MNKIIRVLVADDSAYVRKVVREMLSASPFIEVVGTARDGREALQLTQSLGPDVVISDLMMPELDGVGFVREQMALRALPILMMSSVDENSADTLSALDAGAVDFVQKPTALATEKIFSMRNQLIEKIKIAAAARPQKLSTIGPDGGAATNVAPPRPGKSRFDIIVIGISTGGPQALRAMISQLPEDFRVPIAVVLHMPVGYTAMYAERLNEISNMEVREAADGDQFRPGLLLLAPAGEHMVFHESEPGKVVACMTLHPEGTPHRPSVDVLFRSAAETFGERTLGLIMTGMGSDGREGAAWIKARGGTVYTEAEESCVVYGMPSSVVEAGLSDKIVRLDRLPSVLMEIS